MSERLAGLLLPAFSPRREGDLGIGDTRSMMEWIDLASDHGLGFVQLLPINECGADNSPYNAISSVALDPVYLAMEDVPGVTRKLLGGVLERVNPSGGRVDYQMARACKRDLLDAAWDRWGEADRKLKSEFATFREAERGWLEDYCGFRTLVEKAGTESWDQWPGKWRTTAGARKVLTAEGERMEFFSWVQWLCFRQWRAVKSHADSRGVRLMGDIPIGVSRYSADVFFGRDDFDLEWCGGAPPETMFKHDRFIRKWGQNWGIPLYRWGKMEREGYPWWRQRIDKLTDIFGIFRIDHVLGFYRIYAFPWIPQRNHEFLELTKRQAARKTGGKLPGWSPRPDSTRKNKRANRDDGDRRLKVILEAAGEAAVVGEDLGCVPDYVRPHLASLGIAGFRIPHWDFDEDGQVIPGDQLPECSFATYSTHDHDSIPAMWEDLRKRSRRRSLDKDERQEAREMLRRMADFAGIGRLVAYDDGILWKLIDALMDSNSRFAAIMVNDLFGMTDRINQPGTVGPHNWSFRLPWTASECRGDPAWRRLKESVSKGRRSP